MNGEIILFPHHSWAIKELASFKSHHHILHSAHVVLKNTSSKTRFLKRNETEAPPRELQNFTSAAKYQCWLFSFFFRWRCRCGSPEDFSDPFDSLSRCCSFTAVRTLGTTHAELYTDSHATQTISPHMEKQLCFVPFLPFCASIIIPSHTVFYPSSSESVFSNSSLQPCPSIRIAHNILVISSPITSQFSVTLHSFFFHLCLTQCSPFLPFCPFLFRLLSICVYVCMRMCLFEWHFVVEYGW